MKKERKKWMSLVLAGALVITSVFVPGQQTDAKAKVKLNKKKLVLTVGKKAKLKVKGTKKERLKLLPKSAKRSIPVKLLSRQRKRRKLRLSQKLWQK